MAIAYRVQDAGPPSPALTNPDMILPYAPKYRDYSQSPSRSAIPRSTGPDMAASQGSQWTPPPSGKPSRPSMPGAWQTEEDLSTVQQKSLKAPARQAMGNGALKSPASKFLHTLDPKLRAGLGVELPEYSPSIYSPTDSELAQESPTQDEAPKTPIDELMNEPEDLEHEERFRAFLNENDDDSDDDNSLDLRAEEILANAKKRLAVRTHLLAWISLIRSGNGEQPEPSPLPECRPIRLCHAGRGKCGELDTVNCKVEK